MSVYFATCREANAVKIGSSVDPWGRLPEIQLGCPLPITIEAILPGGVDEEFGYHRWFADYRIRGEWFTLCAPIELLIANNRVDPEPKKKRTIPGLKRQKLAPWEAKFPKSCRHDVAKYAEAMLEMRAAQEAAEVAAA